MTDRVKGFIVTLDQDIREDDAEAVRNALFMVRGVIDVSPVGSDHGDHMNRARIRREIELKIWDALKE